MRDLDGLAELVAERGQSVQRLALLICGDAELAQDIAQASFVKVFLSWPKVLEADDPASYLRRVVVNTAIDESRRRSRRLESAVEVDRASTEDLEGTVSSRMAVASLLEGLSGQQRAVLVLRFWEDLSETQTAEVLGIGVGTVKTHTARAMDRLRTLTSHEEHHA